MSNKKEAGSEGGHSQKKLEKYHIQVYLAVKSVLGFVTEYQLLNYKNLFPQFWGLEAHD